MRAGKPKLEQNVMARGEAMLPGHNNNVKVGAVAFHVQTEDRGQPHALIDTTVYWRGRVLHRRTYSYLDLLPLDPEKEKALRLRLDQQHSETIEELRSGTLRLPALPDQEAPPPPTPGPALALELVNARSWLAGKRATLQVMVRRSGTQEPIEGARVTARMEGAAEPAEVSASTGRDGMAQLGFDMPRLTGEQPTLVIEASHGQVGGHLRFHLRAKPQTPVAG